MLEYAWCFPQNIYTIMIKYHNERHNSNSCKRQVVQDAFESCTCIHSHPGVDRIWKIPTILTKTGISLNIPYSISGWLQSYMHFHHKLFLSGVFSCARAWPYYCSSWKIAIKFRYARGCTAGSSEIGETFSHGFHRRKLQGKTQNLMLQIFNLMINSSSCSDWP